MRTYKQAMARVRPADVQVPVQEVVVAAEKLGFTTSLRGSYDLDISNAGGKLVSLNVRDGFCTVHYTGTAKAGSKRVTFRPRIEAGSVSSSIHERCLPKALGYKVVIRELPEPVVLLPIPRWTRAVGDAGWTRTVNIPMLEGQAASYLEQFNKEAERCLRTGGAEYVDYSSGLGKASKDKHQRIYC